MAQTDAFLDFMAAAGILDFGYEKPELEDASDEDDISGEEEELEAEKQG